VERCERERVIYTCERRSHEILPELAVADRDDRRRARLVVQQSQLAEPGVAAVRRVVHVDHAAAVDVAHPAGAFPGGPHTHLQLARFHHVVAVGFVTLRDHPVPGLDLTHATETMHIRRVVSGRRHCCNLRSPKNVLMPRVRALFHTCTGTIASTTRCRSAGVRSWNKKFNLTALAMAPKSTARCKSGICGKRMT